MHLSLGRLRLQQLPVRYPVQLRKEVSMLVGIHEQKSEDNVHQNAYMMQQ